MFETNDKLRNLPLELMQEDHLIPAVRDDVGNCAKILCHLDFKHWPHIEVFYLLISDLRFGIVDQADREGAQISS
jgi:hypothetical protein